MEIQTFKASKNSVWADKICVDRCYVSVDFKVVSGVLIWRPVPTKMIAIAALKAIPMGCVKDLEIVMTVIQLAHFAK